MTTLAAADATIEPSQARIDATLAKMKAAVAAAIQSDDPAAFPDVLASIDRMITAALRGEQ